MEPDGTHRCPVCAAGLGPSFLEVGSVPALINALWPDAESARDAPRGDIDLRPCNECGMITNVAFDASELQYGAAYENSLHFSPTFAEYERTLAERLIDTYDLHDVRLLEIGSGDGEFLTLLCELGGNEGLGYDPSTSGDAARAGSGRVRFVPELYPSGGVGEAVDFVCARHVLEHLEAPSDVLRGVEAALSGGRGLVYLEVPDARYMLDECAVWDVIYEHPQYFSAPPLVRLVEDAGFEALAVCSTFGGQYLTLEAARGVSRPPSSHHAVSVGWHRAAEVFGTRFMSTIAGWEQRLRGLIESGSRIALWGAGSKGSSFLNLVPAASRIDVVVDLNERKHGLHVAGTGHRIVAPQSLSGSDIDIVLYSNPLYENEIRALLSTLDVSADTIVV